MPISSEILQLVSVNTDAIATNRGFYYQYLYVLKRWIKNYIEDSSKLIFTEVDDDIKEIGDEIIYTQVKCYSKPFNLNSDEIKKSIYNFYILFLKDRQNNRISRFYFETNSKVRNNDKLLKLWIEKQDNLDNEIKLKCRGRIKIILSEEIKKRRTKAKSNIKDAIKKTKYIAALRELEEALDDNVLNDIIACIRWNFVEKAPNIALQQLRSEIFQMLDNKIFHEKPKTLLFDALLSEIYYCSQKSNKKDRVLNSNKIDVILNKTNDELKKYANKDFFLKFNNRLNSIESKIESLQTEQLFNKITLENIINKNKLGEAPKFLTELPYINNNNVFGREFDIKNIKKILEKKRHLVVNGAGGVGKSTIAKVIVQQDKSKYDHIIWLNANIGLLKSFIYNESLIINLKLDFNTVENEKVRFQNLLNIINSQSGNNLLIINDFTEEFNVLVPFLTLQHWNVLITTRAVLKEIKTYKLDKLSYLAAKELYQYHDKETSEELLTNFFQMVNYNTLFIELTAKTIKNSLDLNLLKFIELYNQQELDIKDLEIEIETINENEPIKFLPFLQSTFLQSNLNRDEQFVLELLSLMPTEGTKINDLIEICGKKDEVENKTFFVNIFNSLHKRGWIERENDNINTHTIIQEIILYNLRQDKEKFIQFFPIITWLSARFSENSSKSPAVSVKFIKYGESILRAIKEPYRASIYQPLLILENEVLNAYNWLTKNDTIHDRWKNLLERSKNYFSKIDIPINYNNLLGTIYNNYGKSSMEIEDFELAEELLKDSIKLLEQDKKKNPLNLFVALTNYSLLCIATNNYILFEETLIKSNKLIEEEKLFEKVGAIQCNLLGIVNQKAGNYGKAISMFKIAITLHLGSNKDDRNDLNLALYYNNIAYNQLLENDIKNAIVNHNKALAILTNIDLPSNIILEETLDILLNLYEEIEDQDSVNRITELKKAYVSS